MAAFTIEPATAPRARAPACCGPRTAMFAHRPSCRSPRRRRSRGCCRAEVAALGYDMVLGNTFHLLLNPGPELIERFGGLHRFMGWERPIITDSGGFQVFSMGHGTVADEIKGRSRQARHARRVRSCAIEEEGVRFRSYVDGGERFLSPESSMAGAGGAGLGHRAGVRRVHAVSRRPRLHGALDRAHASLARALPGLARASTDRADQLVYGIVQGGVYEDLRRDSTAGRSRAAAATGSRSAARWGRRRRRCTRSSAGRPRELGGGTSCAAPSAGDRRGRRPDPRRRAGDRHVRLRDADPPRPPRHGAGPRPREPLARRSDQGRAGASPTSRCWRAAPARLLGRALARLPALPRRAGELTGMRLLTLHNLAFLARLMSELRAAIVAGRLARGGACGRVARPGPTRSALLLGVFADQLLERVGRLVACLRRRRCAARSSSRRGRWRSRRRRSRPRSRAAASERDQQAAAPRSGPGSGRRRGRRRRRAGRGVPGAADAA